MKKIIMLIVTVAVALTVAACNAGRSGGDVILENRIEQPEVTAPTKPEPKVCPNIYNGTDDTFHIMNDWSDSNYGAHFVEERDEGIFVLATKVEENMWISMHTTCEGDFSQFRYLALQITAQEGTDYFLTAQEGDTNVLEYIFLGTGHRQQVVIDLKQLAKGDYSSMQMLQIFALPGKVGSAQYTLHDFWLSKEAPEKYVGDATLVSDWKDSWSGCYTVEETQEGSKVSYKNPKLWGNIAARILYPDPQYCQLNMTVEVLGTKKVNAAIKVNYTDLLGNAIQNDAIFSTEIWKPGTNELHLDMSSIFENPEIIPMDLQIFLDSTGNDLTNTENTLLITRTDLSKLTDQATKPKTSNPAGSGAVTPGNGAGPFQTGAGNGYQLKYANGKLTVTMKNVQEWASITYNKPITAKDNKLTITMDNVDDSVTQMQILLMGKSKETMVGVLTKDMLTGHGEPHTYTFYLDDPLKQLGDDLGKGGTLKFQIESAPAAKEQYDGNGKLILSDPILSYVEPFCNVGLGDWYVEWYRAEDISISNQGEYLQVCSVNRKVSANNWSFIAAVPVADAGAGSVFTFEMEHCSGQTGSFLVQIYGEDDSRADVYLSIGEGRTEYTITIPDTVKGLASQIRIYPENAENAAQLPEQSGIVKLYSASVTDKPETLESLQPVLQSADGAITLAQMTQPGSSFYYKTSLESAEETKPELNETDLTDWVLFTEDTVIPSENGITLYVQVIRVEDGKIRGWGESTAVAAGAEFSNTGLQDWYVEWYQEQMVTLSNRGEYLSASVADRKAAAANWAFIAAKPAITAGAGSEFTFELAFSPDRTSGDFLIQIHGSSGQCDLFLPISKARDTYSVKVPDSLKGNVAEIRIFTDNPYKSDSLPAAACELKLYGAALTVSAGGQFENTGFGAWYVPSWADQLTLNTTADCLELSYNRAKAGWQGIEAEVTAQNVTAGGVFTFVVDFGAQRGYTDYFIVQFADENGNEYDSYKVFPEMQNGKAEYAVPVPAQLIGSVSKIRILPENGWATNLPSVDVTVKFYKMCISSP